MIDIALFRKRYTDMLLQITAQQRSVSTVEAYRRYQTDAQYHMQVDTLVYAAVQVIENLGGTSSLDMQSIFEDEVSLHLGWEDH